MTCSRHDCHEPVVPGLTCFGLCQTHLEQLDGLRRGKMERAYDKANREEATRINTDYGRHDRHGLVDG